MGDIVLIGGGLAGAEAAWQAASQGAHVTLYEMRPAKRTPAHKTGLLAELVCSNSLGSNNLFNASAILKEEMRRLNSLILRVADEVSVPAGVALAVDREKFAQNITQALQSHPNIKIVREEIAEIPSGCICIIATGPLTSDKLSDAISNMTNSNHLYFYDAISPIIDADTIDMGVVFRASRYDKGGAHYLNCPMDDATYDSFYKALLKSEKVQPKEFEEIPCFEGCMPIEVMAERGRETMLYGPLKPVGLEDPMTGVRYCGVVQLRAENTEGTCYNMVGFQTRLAYPEQRRVFRLIPGLEKAEFLRYGSMHRNTFINSPVLLRDTLQLKSDDNVFFAGQIVGVEGYTESAAMGMLAGINAFRKLAGLPIEIPPPTTAHGSLVSYITTTDPNHFQPINMNYGLFPAFSKKIRDAVKKRSMLRERALENFEEWKNKLELS